jgi:hypothetical protein
MSSMPSGVTRREFMGLAAACLALAALGGRPAVRRRLAAIAIPAKPLRAWQVARMAAWAG